MFKSFYVGLLHSLQQWRMALLMLLTCLLLALPLVWPIFFLILDTTRATGVAERLMSDQLDLLWLIDLVNGRIDGHSLETTGANLLFGLLTIGLLYSLLHTLLTGGMISVLIANDRRFRMWDFWAGSGLYFGRFFRLMIISRLIQGLCLIGLVLWLGRLDRRDQAASAYSEVVRQEWATVIVVFLVLSLLSMVFDYARIRTVSHNATGMIRETVRAFWFTLRHLFPATILFTLIGVVGLAILAGLVWWRGLIGQSGMGGVLGAFLVGQLAMGVRFWHRIWFHASQIEYYHRTMAPEIIVAESLPPDAETAPTPGSPPDDDVETEITRW